MWTQQGSTRPRPSTFPQQSWPPLPLTLGFALVPPSVKGPLQLKKKGAPWALQSPPVFGVSVKFFRFSAKFWSLYVKIRNNMENIICIPCKSGKHENNKSRPWKYCVTPLKRKEKIFLAKYMIYAVLSRFQTYRNLRVISLPWTWSSSIVPPHPLPLKPFFILFQPLEHK